jgi:hypothetical protein
MIKIPQPAMVLNAENAPEPHYRMWNTRRVGSDEDPYWIMQNVASVARSAPGGKLVSLVINSHGCGSYIAIGKGISRRNVSVFSYLNGLVDTIYLVACRVARIDEPGGYGDGNLLCCEISKNAQAYVYASTAPQEVDWLDRIVVSYGYIDDFEGTLYLYKPPDGSCVVSNLMDYW